MCVSAPVSFSAAAVLAGIGTILVCRVKNKWWLPLAMLPWFFALQQCAEGVIWMYIPGDLQSGVPLLAKNIFLFFAYIFWPIWVPLSLLLIEKKKTGKLILTGCLGMGISFAIFSGLAIPLMIEKPYRFSIHYYLQNQNPADLFMQEKFYMAALLFYGVSTIVPWFISSFKRVRITGGIFALSGALVYYVDQLFFTSLWCFFAAVGSLSLFFVLKDQD